MTCESDHLLTGGGSDVYWIYPGLLPLHDLLLFLWIRAHGISARPGRTGRPRYPEFSWDVLQ